MQNVLHVSTPYSLQQPSSRHKPFLPRKRAAKRTVHAHAGCGLVAAGDAHQLVSRPHAKDGAHAEVGVHDGRAVQGVERDAEALACCVETFESFGRVGILAAGEKVVTTQKLVTSVVSVGWSSSGPNRDAGISSAFFLLFFP